MIVAKRESPIALPHQEEGIRFLRDRSAAALFDEQGLGKTKQLIEAVSADVSTGAVDAALVVCPNGLKSTWAAEIEQHSQCRYAVFGAGKAARRDAFRSLKATFYVINYEAVASEMPALRSLLRFKRFALVLDESHRIKTPGAKVTRAVLALRTLARKRYIMSGTPVANKPEDLWTQMLFLDDGERLGATFEAFRARYMTSNGYVRLGELRDRIASISLRREKNGTIELPAKTISRVSVRMTGEQRRLYDELRTELAVWIQNMSGEEVHAQAENILSRMVRLAQIASNPKLLDRSYDETPVKVAALDELLDSYLADPSQKVIVWTSFVPHILDLCERYRHYHPVSIYGDTDAAQRDAAVRAFKGETNVRLMFANPAAAREGLTLTSANVAIYLDRTFNLVDFLQSQDRIHRISQTRPCEIVVLIAKDSIDEFIDFALAQKHRLARYTQSDDAEIAAADLALQKPDVLRTLLAPGQRSWDLLEDPVAPKRRRRRKST